MIELGIEIKRLNSEDENGEEKRRMVLFIKQLRFLLRNQRALTKLLLIYIQKKS